jgi:hypothetical protein
MLSITYITYSPHSLAATLFPFGVGLLVNHRYQTIGLVLLVPSFSIPTALQPQVCGVRGLAGSSRLAPVAFGFVSLTVRWRGVFGTRGLRLVKLARELSPSPLARGMKVPSLNQLNIGTSNVYSKQLRLQWF